MSVQIVTGYTGERHITPYMDATINRGVFGDDYRFLPTGGKMSASMPDINTFVIADGAFSMQGHVGITNGEQLTVDTCATGSRRIDLVVARFEHDSNTNIDTMSIVLLKGEETTSQYPTTPTYRTGVIAEGANVDMPLYKITLNGSTVSFERIYYVKFPELEWGRANLARNVSNEENKDTGFEVIRSDTDVGMFVGVGSGGINHGIWSYKNGHWMIYEDDKGVARLTASDVRIGGNASGIGTIKDAYLTANRTTASGKWYALCSIVLERGVWVLSAGARWNANSSGTRQANVSGLSGNSAQNISMLAAGNSVTSARFTTIWNISASSQRVYLNVYQNSGSNIVCPQSGIDYGNYLRAVRIK